MNSLHNLALSAYSYHLGECERLRQRVNTLCAIVNGMPDNGDSIYSRMPIVEGEISGDINIEGYRTLEKFFTEELGKLEVAA